LGTPQDGTVESAHRKCMAGLSEVCSHIAIVHFEAFHIETKEACTSQLAQWPVPALKKASMCPIKSMSWNRGCPRSKVFGKEAITPLSESELETLLKDLTDTSDL